MTSTDVKFFFSSSTGVSEIKKYAKALRQTTDEKQKRFLFIWVCFYLLYLAKAGAGKEEWLKIIFVCTTSAKEGRKQYTGEK